MRVQHCAIAAAVVLAGLGAAAPARAADPTPRVEPVSVRFTLDASDEYGVGQLVTVKFSQDIADRAAAERGLSVASDSEIPDGSWGWMDDHTVVYRPRAFWPGNTDITFTVDLAGVPLGETPSATLVGARAADRTFVLQTSRSFIMRIRDESHHLLVEKDGRTVRALPVSLGMSGWETYSGTKILTGEKYKKLRMVGNFPQRNETWDVVAPYSIRLTPNGEFIHGAPWAKHRIGKWNGSHGCTNMFIRDAKWLYQRVQAGDPVVTTGTGRQLPKNLGTPGSYWNYPWKEWVSFSALQPPTGDGGAKAQSTIPVPADQVRPAGP